MNSDPQHPWKRLGIRLLLIVGLLAMVRLVYLAAFSGKVLPRETAEQRRTNVIRSMEIEKEAARKAWVESGKSLPPGGFDVIWNRANGMAAPDEQDMPVTSSQ